jgi:group I intron endonuclease
MITISTQGFVKKNDVSKRLGNIVHRKNCIYSFYFKESEKMYIGQTEDFWHRMSGYRTSIKSGRLKEHQPKLYNAIDKYGYNFTIIILCLEPDNLDDTETSYIEMLIPSKMVII